MYKEGDVFCPVEGYCTNNTKFIKTRDKSGAISLINGTRFDFSLCRAVIRYPNATCVLGEPG